MGPVCFGFDTWSLSHLGWGLEVGWAAEAAGGCEEVKEGIGASEFGFRNWMVQFEEGKKKQ